MNAPARRLATTSRARIREADAPWFPGTLPPDGLDHYNGRNGGNARAPREGVAAMPDDIFAEGFSTDPYWWDAAPRPQREHRIELRRG